MTTPPEAARVAPLRFWPPRPSGVVQWGAWAAAPYCLRRLAKVTAVEVLPPGLDTLRGLAGQRVVLTPSHSGGMEAFVVFYLSRLLRQPFHYAAGHEAFLPPVQGWVLQRVGCYSVVRAAPDREFVRTTRQLLAGGRRWLVLFPEGESIYQNDVLLPFQEGIAQLGFWALDDLARTGAPPPLYFVPMAIKYVFTDDMRGEIDAALARLEQTVGVERQAGDSYYRRLRRLGETVLAAGEDEYGVRPDREASLDDRLQHIKQVIVERAALTLGAPDAPARPLVERIRALLNLLDRLAYTDPEQPDYQRERQQVRQEKGRVVYDDLMRVLQMAAMHDGYVRETLTPERFLDVVGRLEVEVFRRRRIRGPRKAFIQVGTPLDLRDHLGDYGRDRRGAVRTVTTALEAAVQQMLLELGRLTRPIETA